MSDFLKRLAAAKGGETNGGNGNGNGSNILPPDAPERTTPVVAEAAPAAKQVVRPKMSWAKPVSVAPTAAEPAGEIVEAAETPVPAPVKRGRPRKDAKDVQSAGKSFALYIDCMPTKDLDAEMEPTLFEDWVQPLVMTLNEEAMKASNLPDYRLLPFSQEKVALSLAINEAITKSMPSAIVILSSSPTAKDALGVLIPHARQVVRGLRG